MSTPLVHAGILCLATNRTYGRASNGKMLYKCIPDASTLPALLVPYEHKNIGFNKAYQNKYVTFVHSDHKEYRYGTLVQVIGNVNNVAHFYEYRIWCRHLHVSLQPFKRRVDQQLNNPECYDNLTQSMTRFTNRTDWHVFSIDPPGCTDIDDACSIVQMNADTMLVSVYIANVAYVLDELSLWDNMTTRVATLYVPDNPRPMLPSRLSDDICSLRERERRVALTMDMYLHKNKTGQMEQTRVEFSCSLIQVHRNYAYEEPALLSNPWYQQLRDCIEVADSHALVEALMVRMNTQCGAILAAHNEGVFRSVHKKLETRAESDIPLELRDQWYGSYVCLPLDPQCDAGAGAGDSSFTTVSSSLLRHEGLKVDAYAQITSPIRRLGDLLNQIVLMHRILPSLGAYMLSPHALAFYNRWTSAAQMAALNRSMHAIRKLQLECALLAWVSNRTDPAELIEGYLYDRHVLSDGLRSQYTVYLPGPRLLARVKILDDALPPLVDTHHITTAKHMFAVVVFHDEARLFRKLRVQWMAVVNSAANATEADEYAR